MGGDVRHWWLLFGALGCGGNGDLDTGPSASGAPVALTWVEGMGFGWELFNHRLSHLQVRLAEDGASVAVIGGTSTTGVVTDLPPECQGGCAEFPFFDNADVRVSWARAVAPVAVGGGVAELVVGSTGGVADVKVTLEGTPGDGTIALINGLVVDTHVPLEGDPACYRPENGWLPRRIAVGLGEPVISGNEVTVPVDAAFEAGNTLEDDRACLDAVIDRARVRVLVDVLVVSAEAAASTHAVSRQETYAYSGDKFEPGAQVPPDPVPIDLPDTAVTGWSRLDFRFHVDDPDLRGAYLRTLDLVASPADANGTATNFSPGTQLSGFDYAFEGTVRAVDLGVLVTRGTAVGTYPAALTEDGLPILHAMSF